MTQDDFARYAAEGYNRIPVTLELFADLDTPLSVYLKLANAPYTYLLESVVGGERFGRYSFIGLPSSTRLRVIGNRVQVEHGDRVVESQDGDPLGFIEAFQQRFRTPPQAALPRFTGGLVGYFGYETIKLIEKKLAA
ncbi:MAG: anthranilate synthase component I, partial [Microvirgula sp.]